MNWKRFLKPTKKKLILPILVLINIIILVFGNFILPDVINLLNLFIFFLLNFSGFIVLANLFGVWLDNYFVLGVFSIIQFIFWYLLSCWFLERRRKWLPKIILILVIVLNLVLSVFYLSNWGPINQRENIGQEVIRKDACSQLIDLLGKCVGDPSSIKIDYDVNGDGKIEIIHDNWQTFAEEFWGCGVGDKDCARRICGCSSY